MRFPQLPPWHGDCHFPTIFSREGTAITVEDWASAFLTSKPGFDYCDECLAAELTIGVPEARAIAERLGGTADFLRDIWWCGRCGRKRAVTRSLTPSPRHAARVRAAGSLKGARVLVVEDDADSLELLKAVLEEVGARVTSAGSARQALAQVPMVLPDVIVTDLAMPGEDGYWLLREVRKLSAQHGGRVPVLAVTAFDAHHRRPRALAAGFQEYLRKPIHPEELRGAVGRLLGSAA